MGTRLDAETGAHTNNPEVCVDEWKGRILQAEIGANNFTSYEAEFGLAYKPNAAQACFSD